MAARPVPRESNIEKCGHLMIKRPPISGKVRFKAWQSKYFILRNSPPVLEYYKDEITANSPKADKDKHTICLDHNVIHIGTTDGSRTQQHAFMIVWNKHGALMLASENDQLTKEWVEALNRVVTKVSSPQDIPNAGNVASPEFPTPETKRRSLNSSQGSPVLPSEGRPRSGSSSASGDTCISLGFPVTTRLSPSAEKNSIRGDYIMHITDHHVALHLPGSQNPVISWPLIGLRGWKSEAAESPGNLGMQLLTLKSGRKSATGEGVFQFFTSHGEQIAAKIRTHSNVLFASAVEKRQKFKHEKSCSFEDLPTFTSPTVKLPRGKTLNEARMASRRLKSSRLSSTLNGRKRSDSDSSLSTNHPTNHLHEYLSPASLKRDLLKGIPDIDTKAFGTIEVVENEANVELTTSDVFVVQTVNLSSVLEMEKTKESQQDDNAYLDLLVDKNAEPIHIADPVAPRRGSSTSTTSEDGGLTQTPNVSAINEMAEPEESSWYIDDSELNIPRNSIKVQVGKYKRVSKRSSSASKLESKRSESREDHEENSVQNNDFQIYSDPAILKKESSLKQKPPSESQQKLYEDFFAQLANPTAHTTAVFSRESQRAPTSSKAYLKNDTKDVVDGSLESVASTKLNAQHNAPQTATEVPLVQSKTSMSKEERIKSQSQVKPNAPPQQVGSQSNLKDKTNNSLQETGVDVLVSHDSMPAQEIQHHQGKCVSIDIHPKEGAETRESLQTQASNSDQFHERLHQAFNGSVESLDPHELLQRFIAQIETPLKSDPQELFPPLKRNSTGSFCIEHVARDTGAKISERSHELDVRKHVEKSKSLTGFGSKPLCEYPPPLPLRPNSKPQEQVRTRSSSSMGDIFEDIHCRSDTLNSGKKSSFFAKGINIPQNVLSSPNKTNFSACGSENLATARMLLRFNSSTEIAKTGDGSTSPPAHSSLDQREGMRSPVWDPERPRSTSLSCGSDVLWNEKGNDEDKGSGDDGNGKKRRGSKALRNVTRLFKFNSLSPSGTKRRASCGSCPPAGSKEFEALNKVRKGSLTPGIVNEGWSPESSTTPEESPQLPKKSSAPGRVSSDFSAEKKKSLFVGSPTFEDRGFEMKQKARARERERAELPEAHKPAPALPPRKKSDPPPLPPRRKKSFSDGSCSPTTPPRRKMSFDQSRRSPVSRKVSGDPTRGLGTGEMPPHFDKSTPPPPVPPRRDDRRGSQAPAIQLTVSSPENYLTEEDCIFEEEYGQYESPVDECPTPPLRRASGEMVPRLPQMSSIPNMDETVTCPVPKRPPKSKDLWAYQRPVEQSESSSVEELSNIGNHHARRASDLESSEQLAENGRNVRQLRRMARVEKTGSAFSSFQSTSKETVGDAYDVTARRNPSNTQYTAGNSIESHDRLQHVPHIADSNSNPEHQFINTTTGDSLDSDRTRDLAQRPRSASPRTTALLDTQPLARKLSAGNLRPRAESSSPGKRSPARSSPPPLNIPKRSGVLILGNSSPTTPIKV